MSRFAIGDVQGCYEELRSLLAHLRFSADRDRLWFVGDLVNRGPRSLEVLRFVRDLGANATTVLGNHDLHLLAAASGRRRLRRSDTLDEVLAAPDRERLIEWLSHQPLAHREGADLMVHAGIVPQWNADAALAHAREVEIELSTGRAELFEHMYGDQPDRWSEDLTGMERLRLIINVLTRMRLCTREGQINLALKGKPPAADSPWQPWFEVAQRLTQGVRVVFGHWSALGLVLREDVAGLDTGCVWGGALTALDLDTGRTAAVPSHSYQSIED
ncbi:MAG: symmetrical bis(5'-nucleosyl)-tetraphosphatase [Steroidobacteraceae bacterium]